MGSVPPIAGAAGAAIGAVGAGAGGHIEPPPGATRTPLPPTAASAAPAPGLRSPTGGGEKVTGNDDAATALPPIRNPAVKGARPRGNYYLPWVLALLGTMLLLFALLRSCETSERDPQVTQTTTSQETAPAAASAERGQSAPVVTGLTTGTIAYALNDHLASGTTGERTFTFDNLNFRTGSARIAREDQQDLDDVARVLAAYPNARIAVVGFTDAAGGERANARLGGDRANAVVGELAERGVAPDRLEARSGGEAAPAGPNDQAQGRAENRRTELIVLSR